MSELKLTIEDTSSFHTFDYETGFLDITPLEAKEHNMQCESCDGRYEHIKVPKGKDGKPDFSSYYYCSNCKTLHTLD